MAARGQNQGNRKNKHTYAPKPKIPPPPKREDPAKDSICHECGETRPLEGNCPLYLLTELLKKKKKAASGDGGSTERIIERLQHDGLLNSTDLRAFEKCVSCMSGKMARKPYTHQVERAKDLLGLIHTDVCGPFKIMSRQGANYFVTFTDDFSRYGYVYLLKPKHEVFETFKVFQKEVENQLGASTPAKLKRMQNVPYALVVGSIMYAVRCTRLDVAFAQNTTSRFQQNPGDLHWTTVKNILKYLGNTKDMFLVYGGDLKQELRVSCYTDARYLTDADDLKSQTGYVFILNRGAVDWKSAKQSIFASSSAEAEYIAAYVASKEAVWVRKFISGLGVVPTIEEPISMYCDNTRAITIANEPGITKGARHFSAKVRYLREVIEFGDIKLEKVHTDDNLADPFTKALAFPASSFM
ncbi:retrotransposon protein, putative, ty1-copia subclass [Tanacetum coccineum]